MASPIPSQPQSEGCDLTPELTFEADTPETYTPPEICVGDLSYSVGECADKEAEYLASLQAEALNLAGGPVNVFLMLGVHSQGSTQDLVNANGYPISSGTPSGFNALDAFNVNTATWRSIQQGADVLTTPAYIGWSFGTKKAWEAISPAQERYFPVEPVRKQISSIRLKQGSSPSNRATQIRIEASDDGVNWKRIDVVKVQDTDQLVTLKVNSNAKYNQWRLIPTFFNGVASSSQWEIERMQLLEASVVSLDNIQDWFLLENRDRAYSRAGIMLKAQYDVMDVQTELAKFGINLPQTYTLTVSFATMVQTLGRPIVIGDVLEIPGEVQYDSNLRPIRKWLEVTDTAWSTEGYAFNWKPQLFKFYAQPIMPSQEHRDLLGVPGQVNDTLKDNDLAELMSLGQNDQAYRASEAIVQEMKDLVPQTGGDPANIQSGRSLIHPRGSYDGKDLYVQDAIPPNGAAFTSGPDVPKLQPSDAGAYHRQTYSHLPAHMRPADRLMRWDGSVWRVVEVNTKLTPESHRKAFANVLANPNQRPLDAGI